MTRQNVKGMQDSGISGLVHRRHSDDPVLLKKLRFYEGAEMCFDARPNSTMPYYFNLDEEETSMSMERHDILYDTRWYYKHSLGPLSVRQSCFDGRYKGITSIPSRHAIMSDVSTMSVRQLCKVSR